MAEATEQASPESRLYAAGFTTQLGYWQTPTGDQVLGLDDAIAALDAGEVPPPAITVPDTGVRALSDEIVDRMVGPPPPPPPPWLPELADLVAEKLKPVIRAELRKGRES